MHRELELNGPALRSNPAHVEVTRLGRFEDTAQAPPPLLIQTLTRARGVLPRESRKSLSYQWVPAGSKVKCYQQSSAGAEVTAGQRSSNQLHLWSTGFCCLCACKRTADPAAAGLTTAVAALRRRRRPHTQALPIRPSGSTL